MGPLECNVIHGASGRRCHQYSQDTHYHFFCGRVLMFCRNHEAITTPSPLPGQAALRGEWLLHPEGIARAEFFCAFHFIVVPVGGCCCVSIISGPGVTPQTGKTQDSCTFFVIFGQYLRSDGAAAVVVTCSVSHRALRCLLLHRRAAGG